MRILDSKKIPYKEYYYGDTEAISGVEGVPPINPCSPYIIGFIFSLSV